MTRLVLLYAVLAIASCSEVRVERDRAQDGGDDSAKPSDVAASEACEGLRARLPICNPEVCVVRMSAILERGERTGCPEEAATYVDCLLAEADDGHCQGVEPCAGKQSALSDCVTSGGR